MMKDRLRLISGNEPLVLDPTLGLETLGEATDVFKYIDSNFHRWRCGVAGPPSTDTPVRIYEMVKIAPSRICLAVLRLALILSL